MFIGFFFFFYIAFLDINNNNINNNYNDNDKIIVIIIIIIIIFFRCTMIWILKLFICDRHYCLDMLSYLLVLFILILFNLDRYYDNTFYFILLIYIYIYILRLYCGVFFILSENVSVLCVICSWPYPGGIALWADGWQSTDTVHLSRILADKGGKDSRIKNKSVAFNVPFSHFV